MKVIGRVETKHNEDGSVDDLEYIDGYIVKLTRLEGGILRELQNAIDGQGWRIDTAMARMTPSDRNMAPMFQIIWAFIETKFALNSLKSEVGILEEILTAFDESRLEAELDEL